MNKVLPIVILCVLGVWLVVVVVGSTNSPELEVSRWGAITADDGFALDVTNIDRKPIKIAAMTINDRSDCKANPISDAGGGELPIELKVGDKVTFITTCRVIRAKIETDHGSLEFSF